MRKCFIMWLAMAIVSGCSLPEPCDTDEVYDNGVCRKCAELPGHHTDDTGICVEDTVEDCGGGRVNCLEAEGVLETMCLNGQCFHCLITTNMSISIFSSLERKIIQANSSHKK